MIFIGIDPGKKGGLSVINSEGTVLYSEEMLLTPGNKELNSKLMHEVLSSMLQIAKSGFCVIEKSQAMPGQGVTSMFNYGRGYGELIAVLKILKVPYEETHPVKWKKGFSLMKKDKNFSIDKAMQLFPEQSFETPRGRKMDGKAESLLMAEYARRIYNA